MGALLLLVGLGASGCRDSGLESFVGQRVDVATREAVWSPGRYGDHLEWMGRKEVIGSVISVDAGGAVVRTALGDVWIARDQILSVRGTEEIQSAPSKAEVTVR